MRCCRLIAVALVDGAALVALRPDLRELRVGVDEPRNWLAAAGADQVLVVLVGAALWLVALRVGLGLLALLLARTPGALGRVADAVAGVVLPAVVRRVVIGSAGLGVLLAPLAARADGTTHPDPSPTTSVSAPATPAPGPVWPTERPRTTPPPAPPSSPSRPPLPGPGWPRATPHPAPAPAPAPPPRHERPRPAADMRAQVRPGDCLWVIAAHRLGPTATERDVAAYVPRLYAANAGVVGADPDLVTPGQVLDLPSVLPALPPRAQESP